MTTLQEAYLAFKSAQIIDLTHQINENSPHFPLLPALEKKDLFTLKDGFHIQQFTVVGQYGTHIDAPIHFVEGGAWLDELPLEDLLLPMYVIDKSQAVADNPNYELSKADILAFEESMVKLKKGLLLLFAVIGQNAGLVKMNLEILILQVLNRHPAGVMKLWNF